MNAHIIVYYRIRYNALWDYAKYLAVKPEYGGSGRSDWREKLDEVWDDILDTEKKLDYYQK